MREEEFLIGRDIYGGEDKGVAMGIVESRRYHYLVPNSADRLGDDGHLWDENFYGRDFTWPDLVVA